MPGQIFYRRRTQIEEGERKPRFTIVAIANVDLKTHVKHMRKHELEIIGKAIGAELVELEVEDRGHKIEEEAEE